MKKKYLECGKIVSTHGVRGEVKVQPWCDGPDFLRDFGTFYLQKGEQTLEAQSVRTSGNMAIVKIKGIDTMDAAVTLRGKILYIDREDTQPLADGEFFIQDLIGLAVRDADSGRDYGALTDVFATGANDVYEITDTEGKKRLIPAIKEVLAEMNVDEGFLLIRPLKGLFDDAD